MHFGVFWVGKMPILGTRSGILTGEGAFWVIWGEKNSISGGKSSIWSQKSAFWRILGVKTPISGARSSVSLAKKRRFGGFLWDFGDFGILGGFWGFAMTSGAPDQTLRVYTCRGRALRLLRSTRGRDVGWSILDVAFSPDASQCLYSSWSDYSEWGAGLRGGGGGA